ncbi:MAG: transglutaminase domain-containing protein [Thermotogae bacterium]|nr:transglutaminase domain-containing protein [Thermotogota bacterium]
MFLIALSPVKCVTYFPYTRNFNILIKKLDRCGKDDYEKALATYTWIARNIRYDTRYLWDPSYLPVVSPDEVLKKRKTVCEGYARLMTYLLRRMGIVAYTIAGVAKNHSDLKHPIDIGGHAWVIFYSRIKGKWVLADPTWGAGYVSENEKRFHPRFDLFYYDISPEAIIYTHYAEGIRGGNGDSLMPNLGTYRMWRGKEITKEQFLAMPRPSEEFLERGFIFLGPDSSVLSSNFFGRYDLEMRGPKGYVFYVKVLGKQRRQPLYYLWMDTLFSDTITYRIHILWPDTGLYVIEVWMRNLKTNNEKIAFTKHFNSLAHYWIQGIEYPYGEGFVKVYDRFYRMGAYLYGPINGYFLRGDTSTLLIKVPGARRVWVVSGGKRFPIEREKGDVFKGVFKALGKSITVWADGKLLLKYTVVER